MIRYRDNVYLQLRDTIEYLRRETFESIAVMFYLDFDFSAKFWVLKNEQQVEEALTRGNLIGLKDGKAGVSFLLQGEKDIENFRYLVNGGYNFFD